MMQRIQRKAHASVVIGMFAMAFSTAMMTKFHNDFLAGLGFGLGVPLLLVGIRALSRH